MSFDLKLDAKSGVTFCFGSSYRHSFCFSGQYDQFLRDRQKLVERVGGIVKFEDLLLAVELEVRTKSTEPFC